MNTDRQRNVACHHATRQMTIGRAQDMKVAFFTRFPADVSAPRGGIEAVTLALTKAFSELDNIELHVITLEKGQQRPHRDHKLGATIHRLPGSPWPQILDILAGPGRRRLWRYLCELAPDIVHFHESYALGFDDLPMPHVVTVHGFDHANIPAERRPLAWLRAPLWHRVEDRGLARMRHIISITPYVRRHVTPRTSAKIHDIENPIDASFFDLPRHPVRGRVFFAGWMNPRKNPLGLVRAFACVVRRGIDGTLHLAGEESNPDYARQVRAAIQTEGLADRVHLRGRIAPADIRHELSEASVFVLPSRQENSPVAIQEAMAAGVPSISSDRCGMPHMIRNGETGYLIEPDDTETLAERIIRLLTDAELNTRMGALARQEARNRFHPITIARKTRRVYEAILSEGMRW